MIRRRRVEEEIHHDRWLISYADFITLLFAFFVVMYSISQVNESKYRVLSETLNQAFNDSVPLTLDPIQVGDPQLRADPSVIPDGGKETADHSMTGDGAFDRTADLPQLSDLFEDEFSDLIDDEVIQVNSNEFWLEIELKANILFDSADAEPSLQAESIFADVANILKGFDNPVQVEGFTDNVPIRNAQFPSNWELSSARAAAVVKLLERGDVASTRLSAVGYGEHQPVANNESSEGRAANRRVVLMIAREKVERPNVQSEQQIALAVDPASTQASSPFPQPVDGDESEGPLDDDDSPNANLQEEAPAPQVDEQPSSDNLSLLLEGPENNNSEAANDEATAEVPDRLAPVGGITPVELEGGGLLFSSDPDIERN
ncbi:MAG: flagellar motor protein MotD [Cellvibrionaceae bacterium]